jgi:predicted peptidase
MGGCGTWMTAINDPDRFAAIAPICGGGDAERSLMLKNVPIWAFHGDRDNVIPVSESLEMVNAVKKYNNKVKLKIYRNCGHNIWDVIYGDQGFYDWLLKQRRDSK